jgi:PleD family two-component response regulator
MAGTNHGKILIIDDTVDIAQMLNFYFQSQGFDTRMAHRGGDGIGAARSWGPNLILLDINMPDMDGYDVARTLRQSLRTSHIPIMFLTERGEKSAKLAGLELGVDDYITKPFDIDELHLRAVNALKRANQESLTNPVSGLPGSQLIEDQLKALLRKPNWALATCAVNHFGPFNDVYGFVAGDDALKTLAMLLTDVLNEKGGDEDFLGHVGGSDFLLTTQPERVRALCEAAIVRFDRDMPLLYSYQDRKAGYMTIQEPSGKQRTVPLMSLSIGVITQAQGPFTDIRELSEVAAEARQKARLATGSSVYMER